MPDNTNITVRLTPLEKKAIQEYAEKHDLTMSQVVRRALKEFFKEDKE